MEGIEAELAGLARFSLRGGTGPTGYRSVKHDRSESVEWIELDLAAVHEINQVVLVPTLWRDAKKGFTADAFPLEFRILAGRHPDTNGTVLASFSEADHLIPRLAPLVIPCPATSANWLRLEASKLSPRAWDGTFTLQLSEIMVFSGDVNVALQKPVQHSPQEMVRHNPWHSAFLTDGFGPYLMEAFHGEKSRAFVIDTRGEQALSFTIDLGAPLPLDRIHLHAAELGDNVPQAYPSDFGIPRQMVIEGANHPDFSDAILLVDYQMQSIYDIGPILMRDLPGSRCRYVRVTSVHPYIYRDEINQVSRMAFAEVELFSKQQNVALGKPVQINVGTIAEGRSPTTLTDGLNLYGQILPLHRWMNELALRHELERERPLLATAIDLRYGRQKIHLNRMIWVATLLAVGSAIIILLNRNLRQRAIFQTRERIAADLHDELGANLHAIGLLSDLSINAKENPQKLDRLLHRLRALAQRTGTAAQNCSNMLEARGLYENLPGDLRQTAERLMTDLDHQFSMAGEEDLLRLSPRKRIDLHLFYKEALINILRHSGATQVSSHLEATPRAITLIITDNGRGLEMTEHDEMPASLKRRARLLGAQVTATTPTEGGTCITLNLKNRSRKSPHDLRK